MDWDSGGNGDDPLILDGITLTESEDIISEYDKYPLCLILQEYIPLDH